MVSAVAAYFPFGGDEGLVYYHSSPVERYFPVAPGIEVSAGRNGHSLTDSLYGGREIGTSLYNNRGKLSSVSQKGSIIDTRL